MEQIKVITQSIPQVLTKTKPMTEGSDLFKAHKEASMDKNHNPRVA
jgi:hypothetical protein